MSQYDSRTTMFSDEGRLMQVEYAMKAVGQAPPVLGIVTKDGIVFAAHKRVPKLFDQPHSNKINAIDRHIFCAVCGIISDADYLITESRHICQQHMLTFDEKIEVEQLAKQIADIKHRVTQVGGLRPYGVGLLIAGYNVETKQYHLYTTDPSGNFSQWTATSIGHSSADINAKLKAFIRNAEDVIEEEQAKGLAVSALAKAIDKIDFGKQTVELAILKYIDGEMKIEYINEDILEQLCTKASQEEDNEDNRTIDGINK